MPSTTTNIEYTLQIGLPKCVLNVMPETSDTLYTTFNAGLKPVVKLYNTTNQVKLQEAKPTIG